MDRADFITLDCGSNLAVRRFTVDSTAKFYEEAFEFGL